jgi:hypothetical protein
MTESAVQKTVINYLEARGYLVTKVTVANHLVLDLIVCGPAGQYIEIEVKAGKGKMSVLQTLRQETVRHNKGISFTVWSIKNLENWLKVHNLPMEIVHKELVPNEDGLL